MNTLIFEAKLAKLYNYKKLPPPISRLCRETYIKNIPASLSLTGGGYLYTKRGNLITDKYNRIVVGDYGAFVEFEKPTAKVVVKSGEEYRLTNNYQVKYEWLTIPDGSDIKIYHQKHTVDYADYLPDMLALFFS